MHIVKAIAFTAGTLSRVASHADLGIQRGCHFLKALSNCSLTTRRDGQMSDFIHFAFCEIVGFGPCGFKPMTLKLILVAF